MNEGSADKRTRKSSMRTKEPMKTQDHEGMKLYHLTQRSPGYDQTSDMIVRASSPEHARDVARDAAEEEDFGENPNVWLDPKKSTCVRIPVAHGEVGVVRRATKDG